MPPLAGAFKLYAADNPAAFNTWGNQSEDDLVIVAKLPEGEKPHDPQTLAVYRAEDGVTGGESEDAFGGGAGGHVAFCW